MALKTVSVLRLAHLMPPERVEQLYQDTIELVADVAQRDLGDVDIIVRDLLPSDFPGYTANEWTETSGATDNAWDTTTGGNGGSIADETFMGILGVQFLGGITALPVSALRFTVGASLVAQWSLYLPAVEYTLTTSGATTHQFPVALAETPIIIRQNQTLKVEEYVIEINTAYQLAFIGFVAEKVGKTLSP